MYMDIKGILKEKAGLVTDLARSLFKKELVTGLDIGQTSVKAAQFTRKEDGFHLVKARFKEIKPFDGKPASEEEVLSSLKELLKDISLKGSEIIVSINSPKTALRKIKVPFMPKKELREAIRMELKNYFPFPVEDAFSDFEITGHIVEDGVKKYQILLAVSPRDEVDRCLLLLKKAGIKADCFLPAPYALWKLGEGFLSGDDQVKCLIDVGAHWTELIIFSARQGNEGFIFSRKIPVSGSDFSKALTANLASDKGRTELALEEAEQLKIKVGLPLESSLLTGGKVSAAQVVSMLRFFLEQFVDEIGRCFDYIKEDAGISRINSLVLLGGGGRLKGLKELLSRELDVKVESGFSFADGGREEAYYELALAAGSALGSPKGMNLLPLEIKEQRRRTFKRSALEAIGAAVIAGLALIYIGMGISLTLARKRVSVSVMELAALAPQLRQAEMFSLLAAEPYWEDVFEELGNVIPDDIYLTQISVRDSEMVMRGIVISQQAEESLSDFIFKLTGGLFNQARLVKTREMTQASASEFELVCRLD